MREVYYGTVCFDGEEYFLDIGANTLTRHIYPDKMIQPFEGRRVKITIKELTEETQEDRILSKCFELSPA